MVEAHSGLRAGGRALWRSISASHDLDVSQLAQLTEACRAKDRLDQLDQVLRNGIDPVLLVQVSRTAISMQQLPAALRLPDPVTGRRPQHRGPRGTHRSPLPGGRASVQRLRAVSVTSPSAELLDRDEAALLARGLIVELTAHAGDQVLASLEFRSVAGARRR